MDRWWYEEGVEVRLGWGEECEWAGFGGAVKPGFVLKKFHMLIANIKILISKFKLSFKLPINVINTLLC